MTDKEFEEYKSLVTEYMKRYPNEPDPTRGGGIRPSKDYVKILKEAKGRKIRYKTPPVHIDTNIFEVYYEE